MSAKKLKAKTTITEFEERPLGLSNIEWHPELLQVRENLDKGWVLEYSRGYAKGDPFPPVLVYQLSPDEEHPQGRLVLADGFHRVDAARSIGLKEIRAQIREGTITDALLAALEANTAAFHRGRKFEEADRKHAAELMIRNQDPGGTWDWSDNEIGRRVSLSPCSVKKLRNALMAREGVPIPEKVRRFKNGTLDGTWVKYKRTQRENRVPSSTSSRGGRISYRANLDGRVLRLGSNADIASARLQEIKNDTDELQRIFADHSAFIVWLLRRNIYYQIIPSSCFPLNGCYHGTAAFHPIASINVNEILGVIGRLLLVRAAMPTINRTIAIGYIGAASGKTGALIPHAERLGIEFMTPDEFLAEFGPKGDPSPLPEEPPAT